ncbi:hypothetical protein [Sphingobium sp. BS19]|uniref:hypothetical protein n=1 Tax=Sphingobium sp. BS19 TaxID=3018973 RepID=UPI0022EFC939|nr:hypothetical protein [Sphingobium sp. BS19]GLI99174.1 hypothetical protein Sbs19_29920 [Sphingobium sp. BS19]
MMIEKIARAMGETGPGRDDIVSTWLTAKELHDCARAALKELLTPTPEMIAAGQQCEALGGDGGQIYRAMIQAALHGEGR